MLGNLELLSSGLAETCNDKMTSGNFDNESSVQVLFVCDPCADKRMGVAYFHFFLKANLQIQDFSLTSFRIFSSRVAKGI